MKFFGWLIPGWVKLAALGVVAAFLVYSGWQVRDWQCEAAEGRRVKAEQAAKDRQLSRQNDIASEYKAERESARQAADARQVEIRTIYRDIPAPSPDCEPPADAVRVLDNAITEANGTAP